MKNIIFKSSIVKGGISYVLSAFIISLCSCTSNPSVNNIIPKPVESEFLSGSFKPKNNEINNIDSYVESNIDLSKLDELGNEGYELAVSKSSVKINAASETGIYYGKQTLKQLINNDAIPCVKIKDKPRFPYRGMHLDVSRHFFSKEQVFKILDEVAGYKLNYFHFHLTDNGGWRIQIDKYPLLTKEGAYRTQKDWYQWWDKKDRKYLPEGTPGAYGGYYTKSDIREILDYAAARHITVIPEIEFPAHSDAVTAAYPELCCTGKPYTSGEFCVGNETVYTFMEDVLGEIMELFPSKYIHVGGDEARKVAWHTCSKCADLIKKENLNGVEGLQPYMMERIQDFVASKGREMIGWDELLHNKLNPETVIQSYRGQKGAIEAANQGNYAVMTPGEVLYFDWYQDNPATERRAMYGYTPIKKMYSFIPVPTDLASSLHNEQIIQGKEVDPTTVQFISPEKSDRIIGVQGCMWTEYIEDEELLEYMIFPRLLAISEIAWTPESKREWNDFKTRMNAHIPVLQSKGIRTFTLRDDVDVTTNRCASTGDMIVVLDCEKSDVEIRYTLDGSAPDSKSHLYKTPFTIDDSKRIKAAIFQKDKICGPVCDILVDNQNEINDYFPFIVPDVWKGEY